MKKVMYLTMLAAALVMTAACSSEDPFDDFNQTPWGDNGNSIGNNTGGASSVGSSELTSFTVDIDKTTQEPESTAAEYFPDEEDNLDNNSFDTEIKIAFNGNSVTYDTATGISITADGAHVVANHGSTKGVCYVVSGTTTAGSLTIVGDKKYEVKLADADITNPDSTALNLLSKKRAYVVLSGNSKLTDGATSKAADQKAALYCKGKLLFNGTGSLDVYGNYNNAIHSADYIVFRKGTNIYAKSTANHGIKANDGVYINGGILNVEVSAAAAKGINSEGDITINGGRTTVIATGNGTYEDGEAKGAAAIKCDSTYTQNGGEVRLKATGSGGKGLKSDWEAYVNDGSLYVITEGSQYSSNRDTASPKGIKVGTKNVHGVLNIYGGTVMVRTQGTNAEGIESKGTLTISAGNVLVSAYDDGINSAGDMYLMGGNIVSIGRSNDGIDANGNMYISGGNIVAFGAGGAESGIDTGEQYKLYITGGAVFGIGGRVDATYSATTDAQAYATTTGSVTAGSTVTVSNGSTTLATFTMPSYSYSNGAILVSAPGMANGSSYTLSLGSTSQTVTATTSAQNSGMGGMGGGPGMGGGGMPGGRF